MSYSNDTPLSDLTVGDLLAILGRTSNPEGLGQPTPQIPLRANAGKNERTAHSLLPQRIIIVQGSFPVHLGLDRVNDEDLTDEENRIARQTAMVVAGRNAIEGRPFFQPHGIYQAVSSDGAPIPGLVVAFDAREAPDGVVLSRYQDWAFRNFISPARDQDNEPLGAHTWND